MHKLIFYKSFNYQIPEKEYELFIDTCVCNVGDAEPINFTFDNIVYPVSSGQYFDRDRDFQYIDYNLENEIYYLSAYTYVGKPYDINKVPKPSIFIYLIENL